MTTRYHITLPDTERAHGAGEFAFRSQGAEGLAGELQDALRSDALFQRWRATQEDPDSVDPALGATDPAATVSGEMHNWPAAARRKAARAASPSGPVLSAA